MMLQVVAFVVMVVVWAGAHGYAAWRLEQPLREHGRRLVRSLLGVHFVLVPMAMMMRLVPVEPVYTIIHWIAYIGMGAFSLLVVGLVAVDTVRFVTGRLVRWTSESQDDLDDPERRRLIQLGVNGGLLAATVTASSWGFYQARRLPDVVEVDVPFEQLPPQFDGFRIVQLSDLHVGQTIRRPRVEAIAGRVAELQADMIVITGDLIEGDVDRTIPMLQPLFELDPPQGICFATGNHEYYWDGPGWCEALSEAGVEVLLNDHRLVEREDARLLVAGCTDYRAGRHVEEHKSDPAAALEGAPEHDLSILLAHQPPSIYEAADAGYDLQLSGHTHGGQFWPFNYVVGLVHPFTAGLDRYEETRIYVSRGTGYWGPPLRLAAPSEITLLTLRRGDESLHQRRRISSNGTGHKCV